MAAIKGSTIFVPKRTFHKKNAESRTFLDSKKIATMINPC